VKLSDYVFQFIADQGVRHVFMLPGGGAMHLNDSLGRCKDIEYVCNLHEQACAIAAEAYAKVSGNLGVALVTTGPGGTNAITGVAAAWLDSTPCLFISGQVKRDDMKGSLGVRQLGVQELDIVSLVKSITKYAATVTDPSTIGFHLEKAVHLARSGRPGPVWIDIPLDVQASVVDPQELARYHGTEATPRLHLRRLTRQVARVIRTLNDAERPVILVGNGVRLARAEADLLAMVKELGIPVMTTWMGVDLVPYEHELLVGSPGSIAPRGANFALQNSDWLLVIGARLDMAMIGYAPHNLARAAVKTMVDIDANEIRKLAGAIDLPIVCDAKVFIAELRSCAHSIRPRDRSAWISRCKEWKKKYPVVLPEHRTRITLSAYYFYEVLSEELSGDELIAPGSSGVAAEIFFQVFRPKGTQRVFHHRGLGAMGFALPASIGACFAGDGRKTISVDGDGGFQLNIHELELLARYDLPVKLFILDNQGYASIRASQQKYFGRLTGADSTSGLTLPDPIAVASAYGLSTACIESPTNVRQSVRDVLHTQGPVVCKVVVSPDEVSAPRLSSAQRPDGSMVSKPLEDLWPFLSREEFLSNMIIPPLD
jgi:acetolactate synthase-1/2/3 large subunit